MKISIVIPCFNAVEYSRATLDSVVGQKEKCDVEIIVVDGESTDGSLEILNQYRSEVATFISEPDEGHYDAVNKGMALATGDVLCWLNTDDIFVSGALSIVSDVFDRYPDIAWLSGMPAAWDSAGRLIGVSEVLPVYNQRYLCKGEHDALLLHNVLQPTSFWRRELWNKVGEINTTYDIAGDYDLWTRMAEHAELVTIDTVLGGERKHDQQRSNRFKQRGFDQVRSIRRQRGGRNWAEVLLKRVSNPVLRWKLKKLLFTGKGKALFYDRNGGWSLEQRRVVR